MNGILLIDKSKNCTSHDVVYKVKKIYNQKVGHTGTLDPNATGVLPLLIGKATLISKYLINHDKIYEATIYLGEKRDTADEEGNIVEEKEVNKDLFTRKHIEEVLKEMIGKQNQVPPIYSAIKVNGKKLYEYARKGEKVDIKSREIEIYDIELINIYDNFLQFKVFCSKGTYIRTLCEEIAEKLDTVGYMKDLKRLQVGDFNIKNTITLEEIEDNRDNNKFLESKLITIEEIFKNKGKLIFKNEQLNKFLNGVKLSFDLKDDLYRIYNEKKNFIGIGKIENKKLKRDIIV